MRCHTGILASGVNLASGTCTDVLREPFDNLAAWALTNTVTIVAGRTGTAAQIASPTSSAKYTIPSAAQSDTVTFGFAWRRTDAGTNREIWRLYSDGGVTLHNKLTWSTSGQVTIFVGATSLTTSAAGALPGTTNVWYYVETQIKLHDTAGYVIVRVDGVEVINATGLDTKNAGTMAVYEQLQITVQSSTVTNQWDDLYLSTGSGCAFKGDQTVVNSGPDVLLEPFNNTTAWVSGFLSSVAGGRTGNMGQITGSGTSGWFVIPAAAENATITIGFAFKTNLFTAVGTFLQLLSDTHSLAHETFQVTTAGEIKVRLGAVGGGVVATSATGLIVVNTWYYFETQVTMSDTTGSIVVRLDGTTVINVSGIDTKAAGTKTVYDSIQLSAGGTSTTHNFDDLYITMGAGAPFKGSITIP